MHYLPILSTLVSFIFAGAVLARWRYKKPNNLLFWGLGLVFYGLGTLSEVVMSFTFNAWVLRMWYLCGAMLTAAWLGQGTVYLLVRKKRIAHALMLFLVATSALGVILIAVAPINVTAAAGYHVTQPISTQYKEILTRSGMIILLTIVLNIYGTLTLVGGALYSAYLFWRKSILANRMLGNLLIAGGAMAPAMAGSFVKAGLVDWLYLSEFIGVVLMYGGFTLATAQQPGNKPAALATD
jgi:hypothetical protein